MANTQHPSESTAVGHANLVGPAGLPDATPIDPREPYVRPHIASELRLEARAGTPLGGLYDYGDPSNGVRPKRKPILGDPYGTR